MANYIGIGVYTLQEAAFYGSLSANKLSRWFFVDRIVNPQIQDEKLISFRDLIQAKSINAARELGISLQKIRAAIKTAQDDYDVEFPLAQPKKLLYYGDNLYIKLERGIYQVSGRQRHQQGMQPIIEPYAKDLRFDAEGFVCEWIAYAELERQITLNPKRQFGQPLVGNTGYSAETLATAAKAEGSIEAAANIFNVLKEDIQISVDYINSLNRKAA